MPKQRVTSPSVFESPLIFSQALRAGDLLFISGQVARDINGSIAGQNDVRAQARIVFERLKALCEAAGATMDGIVKLVQYLPRIEDAPAVREVMAEYFTGPDYPTSTLIGGIELALPDFLVEIEAVVSLA